MSSLQRQPPPPHTRLESLAWHTWLLPEHSPGAGAGRRGGWPGRTQRPRRWCRPRQGPGSWSLRYLEKISIIQQLTRLADAHSPLTEGAYGAAIVAEAAVVVVAVQVHRVQVPLVFVEMRDSFVEYEQMVDGPDHVVVLREGEEAEVGSFEVELHPPGAGRAAEAHHEAEHGGGAEHRDGVGEGDGVW